MIEQLTNLFIWLLSNHTEYDQAVICALFLQI